MHQPVTPSLTMKRRLNASPAEVYKAWTDPDLLVRWFGPENVVAQEAEIDPRVDGAYRVVMIENTGERHEVLGRYLEVVENQRHPDVIDRAVGGGVHDLVDDGSTPERPDVAGARHRDPHLERDGGEGVGHGMSLPQPVA